MRPRHASIIAVGLAMLAGMACGPEGRIIKLPGAQLETLGAIDLRPSGMAIAASPDGRFYAVGRDVNKDRAIIEIRDFETQSVRLSLDCKSGDPFPVMFDRNGTHAILVGSTDTENVLYSVDLSNGSRAELSRSTESLNGILTNQSNADRSILSTSHGEESVVLTSSGNVFHAAGTVLYDTYGNAWFKDGAGWAKVDGNGHRTAEPTRPPYLVPDQSDSRGSMRLVEQQTRLEHMNVQAYLTTIWLEDTRGIGHKAALVCSFPDVMRYGFVPGREAVYAVTATGTYIVPYTITEK